jgi:ATP-dependent DNA helicase RecG
VTEENILREQSARNPKIVRLINKFPNPPNKDVGEGLNTAFEAMEKLRLKKPEIEEKENSVVVYVAHSPLGSPERTREVDLLTDGSITTYIVALLSQLFYLFFVAFLHPSLREHPHRNDHEGGRDHDVG